MFDPKRLKFLREAVAANLRAADLFRDCGDDFNEGISRKAAARLQQQIACIFEAAAEEADCNDEEKDNA